MKSGHSGPQNNDRDDQHNWGDYPSYGCVIALEIYYSNAKPYKFSEDGADNNRYATPKKKFEPANTVGYHVCFNLSLGAVLLRRNCPAVQVCLNNYFDSLGRTGTYLSGYRLIRTCPT